MCSCCYYSVYCKINWHSTVVEVQQLNIKKCMTLFPERCSACDLQTLKEAAALSL